MATQWFWQIRMALGSTRLATLAAATVLSILAVRPGDLYALRCGDTITANTTLHANLGPCTGIAIQIGADNVTLNLNGFTITGPFTQGGGSEGVDLGGHANVTIKGPGTIAGFDDGVAEFTLGSQGTIISHVHFVGNTTRAVLLGNNGNQILNSTFSGNSCMAIKIDGGGGGNGDQIVGNAISGSNAPPLINACGDQSENDGGGGVGIELHIASGTVVKQNTVTSSTNAIFADSFSARLTITGNDCSGNSQDGIATAATATITSNQTNGNARDGIAVALEDGFMIKGNTANSNGRRGIGLGDKFSVSSGNNSAISFNRTLGNATDLFWDGTGTGNCWKGNIFDSSSPASLPACP